MDAMQQSFTQLSPSNAAWLRAEHSSQGGAYCQIKRPWQEAQPYVELKDLQQQQQQQMTLENIVLPSSHSHTALH